MNILFLAPYPKYISASQRFRIEIYFKAMEQAGIQYTYKTFMNERLYAILYTKGNTLKKITGLVKGFVKRFFLLFTLHRYNYLFIHREATPIGPPWFEFIAAKILRKKIIYDFDDAIWISLASTGNKLLAFTKATSKVKSICKWSTTVVVGNDFLANYAKQYSKNVIIIPTPVDTEREHNQLKNQQTNIPVVGWTGTFTNLKFFDLVIEPLKKLQQEINFTMLVIGDKDPKLPLPNYQFISWKKETEIEDLLQINIGIMPLHNTEATKGKCGFKAIQYMALGIPALVSPIAINKQIVDDGTNGYWCANEEEWYNNLKIILKDAELRKEMGISARAKIVEHYSLLSTKKAFLKIFE
jgi:glycosyltransferase involved in cell wall biosynthesis